MGAVRLSKNDRITVRCDHTEGGDVWGGGSNAERGLTNFRGFHLFDLADPAGVAFTVTKNAVQANIGSDVITFQNIILNEGGGFNVDNSRFVAPRHGVYSFGVNALSNGGKDPVELAFFKNGEDYNIGCYDGEDDHTSCVMTTLIELCKGEYVDVRSRKQANAGLYGDSEKRGLTHFYGYLTKGHATLTSCTD